MAFAPSAPDPCWIWTAEVTAASAASLRVDPGLPLQYINTTLQPALVADRFTLGERNTLLYDGMSTTRVGDDGTVIIERMVTNYQQERGGSAADNNSYLGRIETLYSLMFVARDLSNYLLTRYARQKLVNDGTPVTFGSNCVTPNMIQRLDHAPNTRALEAGGYAQDKRRLRGDRSSRERRERARKVLLAPVRLVNQLRQIALFSCSSYQALICGIAAMLTEMLQQAANRERQRRYRARHYDDD